MGVNRHKHTEARRNGLDGRKQRSREGGSRGEISRVLQRKRWSNRRQICLETELRHKRGERWRMKSRRWRDG